MSRAILSVFICLFLAAACLSATSADVVEKKFSFPPPVQWKRGNWEVSLIGLAWGPANSPEMISKEHQAVFSREKPTFYPDWPYALALKLRAYSPSTTLNAEMYGGSGLVLIKNVSGDFQVPMVLSPTGFTPYSGSPGTMDLAFKHSNTTEQWDFFPVSPRQKEFLFQSFAFSSLPSSRGAPNASFKVLIRHGDLVVVNALPETQNLCPDFTRSFSGTIGSGVPVSLQLAVQGANASGTEQYERIGKTLQITGHIDTFGNFELQEQYPNGQLTGIFKGEFSRGCQTMSGYFSKPDGSRLLPFELQQNSKTAK